MLLLFLPGDYEKNSIDWSANPVQTKYGSTKVIYTTAALAFVPICFVHLAW